LNPKTALPLDGPKRDLTGRDNGSFDLGDCFVRIYIQHTWSHEAGNF
jgi:hypothetical protein